MISSTLFLLEEGETGGVVIQLFIETELLLLGGLEGERNQDQVSPRHNRVTNRELQTR